MSDCDRKSAFAGLESSRQTKGGSKRAPNPWPAPPIDEPKQMSGFGGFGGGYKPSGRFGGDPYDWQRGARPGFRRPSDDVAAGDRRPASALAYDQFGSGGFGGTSDFGGGSGSINTPRRAKTVRRTPRRKGPGHCYNCGQQGHISKVCPLKEFDESKEDEDRLSPQPFGFEGDIGVRMGAEKKSTAKEYAERKTPLMNMSFQTAKLENQKIRDSYYNSYTHGETSVKLGSVVDEHEIDEFSEQLDFALKVDAPVCLTPPRPSRPMKYGTAPIDKDEAVAKARAPVAPVENGRGGCTSEKLTIETRRSVTRDDQVVFVESTLISFPRDLPPCVHIVAAQFTPASAL